MTKIIGLTGGIGSGKSTIAKHFKSLGVPVYIADVEAKKIMESSAIIKNITLKFGTNILENGLINKEKLAQIVFSKPEELKILNDIIHPEVKKHFKKWFNKQQNHKYIIKEAAILFESGSYLECDYIISVVTPLEKRIERILKRDNISLEDIMKRVKNQWNDEDKIAKSDFVIYNENLAEALVKTNEIHVYLNNL